MAKKQQHEREDKPQKTVPLRESHRIEREQAAVIETLRERIDTLRLRCMAMARRLEMAAALEHEHHVMGLPPHLIKPGPEPAARELAWKVNSFAVATWMRAEAELLHRIGEGIE